MRIKKFFADSYREALLQVKQQVGEDALILDTRPVERVPGNQTGVEITVALEQVPHLERREIPCKVDQATQAPAGWVDEKDPDLKSLIFTLFSQTDRARSLGLKDHQLETYTRLVRNGVNERLASKILEKVCHGDANTPPDPREERGRLVEMMKRALLCRGKIELAEGETRVVAFVGPTGAGKTTTIAKLAADFAFRQEKKVALISLDTFRIGAIDQLRLYGEIMQIPVELACNPPDFEALVQRHHDKDIILVDTMGRSHRDEGYSEELKEIFENLENLEIHLVLSITSQEQLFEKCLHQFSPLGIDRLLFTKLDEGLNFGPIFNFSLRARIPFSYFAMGQRVPEDIEVANKDKVISLIFN